MIIIFTGDGKGKTSAALGTAFRSLGWGRSIYIIQFIKGNKEIGEWKIINKITQLSACRQGKFNGSITIKQFINDKDYGITENEIKENEKYKKSCKQAWNFAQKIIKSKKYDLVILDEIINAMHYKLVSEKDILNFINKYSQLICGDSPIDIILTGRNSSKRLIDIADIVTEMKNIKHIFQKGISAKRGIDY